MKHTISFLWTEDGMEMLAVFLVALTKAGAGYTLRQYAVAVEVEVTGY